MAVTLDESTADLVETYYMQILNQWFPTGMPRHPRVPFAILRVFNISLEYVFKMSWNLEENRCGFSTWGSKLHFCSVRCCKPKKVGKHWPFSGSQTVCRSTLVRRKIITGVPWNFLEFLKITNLYWWLKVLLHSDSFDKLNNLNCSLQGPSENIITATSKLWS